MNKSQMTPSSRPSCGQDGLPGYPNPKWIIVWTNGKKMWRILMKILRRCRTRQIAAESERYRRYHEAKSKIPMDLPPDKYEEELKRLARKFKI